MDNARIEENKAQGNGGGFYNAGYILVRNNTARVTGNGATNGGGVANSAFGVIDHTGSEVVSNAPNNIVSVSP